MSLVIKYPYLRDSSFLMDFAKEKNLEQTVKISIMDFNEKILREIKSHVISGSINIDGSSSIRRTANLSVFIDENEASYMEIGGLFSLNKKIKIEMGFTNNTGKYTEFPILWFPLGVYVIMNLSSTHAINGTTISLQLKDKMVFLNGECGGTISASVVFHELDEIDPLTGNYYVTQPTIIQIIQELVNHFGGEQLGKIIISDLDTRIKKVMKWTQSVPLYLYQKANAATFSLNEKLDGYEDKHRTIFETGQDVGYIYSDFYYPGELIANSGESVCSILDKIKNTLGNFEYFYDLEGNFIFQEIKNYLNTSQVKSLGVDTINQTDYLINTKRGTSVYSFNNPEIISSYANNPQYSQIKNDFIVWGERPGVDGKNKYPIRYHLAIDSKPQTGNTYSCYFHEESDGILKAKVAVNYSTGTAFPNPGEVNRLYKDNSSGKAYVWNPKEYYEYEAKKKDDKDCEVPFKEVIEREIEGVKKYYFKSNYHPIGELTTVTTTDWRTELYLQGALTTRFGQDSNPYYSELVNEWPKLYNVEEGKFHDDVIKYTDGLDYYLDFIDSTAKISEISISNIGRRTKVINDSKINCIFEKPIPDFILLENENDDIATLKQECEEKVQPYIQVSSSIYKGLAPGGRQNSAYNAIRDLLYQYTSYNESVSVQMIPMYFLEPNTRITLQDNTSGIKGDYMIKSIALSLDINGSMSLSCIKALERI